jgi:hypothetical protein
MSGTTRRKHYLGWIAQTPYPKITVHTSTSRNRSISVIPTTESAWPPLFWAYHSTSTDILPTITLGSLLTGPALNGASSMPSSNGDAQIATSSTSSELISPTTATTPITDDPSLISPTPSERHELSLPNGWVAPPPHYERFPYPPYSTPEEFRMVTNTERIRQYRERFDPLYVRQSPPQEQVAVGQFVPYPMRIVPVHRLNMWLEDSLPRPHLTSSTAHRGA